VCFSPLFSFYTILVKKKKKKKKTKKENSSPMAVELCSFDAPHRAAPGDTLDLNLFVDLPPVFAR